MQVLSVLCVCVPYVWGLCVVFTGTLWRPLSRRLGCCAGLHCLCTVPLCRAVSVWCLCVNVVFAVAGIHCLFCLCCA